MTKYKDIKKLVDVASGRKKASMVLKNGTIVNVFTEKTEEADIAIEDGFIAGVGEYDGIQNIDMKGKYLCPGFIDGHIHIESSMVYPPEFEKAVLPHGTTAVITDPHEIANVAGLQGIDYMLEASKGLDLDIFFVMPSCVPSTALDESGAVLDAGLIKPYYADPRVLGLAEVMNARGVAEGESGLIAKLRDAGENGLVIDGHAPFLQGKGLSAYVCAGVMSDHECSNIEEAIKKLERGQWIMIREGTAARNLEALMPLFKAPNYQRCMLVTDDKHPGDLLAVGHIDAIIRKAVSLGADPVKAIKMGTLHAAQYFGLKDRGALMPGMRADVAVLEDLKDFKVQAVYKDGKPAARDGECLNSKKDRREELKAAFPRVYDSFHMEPVTAEDIKLEKQGDMQRVIQLVPHELLTGERLTPWQDEPGLAPGVSVKQDIVKAVVFERHLRTGHIGLGFIGGYGLTKGAVATSVAHDSHNLIVVGTTDRDIAAAANVVINNKGGLAVVVDGRIVGELALPIAGVMADVSASQVEERLKALKDCLKELGIKGDIDAFMTLAFVSLPVIPKLRLNTFGIIDVERQEVKKASWNPN